MISGITLSAILFFLLVAFATHYLATHYGPLAS